MKFLGIEVLRNGKRPPETPGTHENKRQRDLLNGEAGITEAAAGSIESMRAYLRDATPRARAKLCNQPNHAAWDAIREAEDVAHSRGRRSTHWAREQVYGIDRVRILVLAVARHAGY